MSKERIIERINALTEAASYGTDLFESYMSEIDRLFALLIELEK